MVSLVIRARNAIDLFQEAAAPALNQDWQDRISGAGVVWYHGFESLAEVRQFQWASGYGNDPLAVGRALSQNVRLLEGGGPDGMNCLEITRPAGTAEVGVHWWRQYSPLNGASNGRGVDDPAAGGTLALQSFSPTDGGSQTEDWGDRGFYGHSSYHTGSVFSGTEYWLQMRVKMDPRRAQAGMPQAGKLTYQTITNNSNVNQEIVTYSGGQHGTNPTQNNHQMYRGWNFQALWDNATGSGGSSTDRQPGSELGACNPAANPNTCWAWSGGWDTVLYHIVPGRDNVDETVLQVYAAHEGETAYTKIWDIVFNNRYDAGQPFGYNAMICSTYNNNNDCPSDFWHRYAQIIFSHAFIPCPSSPPSWATELALDTWTALPGGNTLSDVAAADVGQYGNGDPGKVFEAWNGAALVDFGASKSIFFWGGGHQDYYGNEVYCLDLATRQFSRLTEPTDLASYGGPHTNGIYSDGNPSPAHTYYFVAGRDSEFLIGRRQINNTPSTTNMISTFNPTTETWTNSTASAGISPGQGDGMCYDSLRDGIWMVECDVLGWAFYDIGANTWTTYTAPASAFDPSAGPFYCPTKDCVIFFAGTNIIRGLDPASPNTNSVSLTRSGTPPTFGAGDMACWSDNFGAFVYYPDGSNSIYLFTPPAGDWRTGAWTWTQRTVTGTTGNHTGNGTYGKFQVVEWGSVTVAVVADDPDGVPRAVRLS